MKWAILALFLLLLCQGAFSAYSDWLILERQDRTEIHCGQMHARIDTLEAALAP